MRAFPRDVIVIATAAGVVAHAQVSVARDASAFEAAVEPLVAAARRHRSETGEMKMIVHAVATVATSVPSCKHRLSGVAEPLTAVLATEGIEPDVTALWSVAWTGSLRNRKVLPQRWLLLAPFRLSLPLFADTLPTSPLWRTAAGC